MIEYTNAQIRSILNGLGYRSRLNTNDPDFPVSEDESELTDEATQKAIQEFQVNYDLEVNGIADEPTMTKMQEEMNALHNELNRVVGTNISQYQPFYGSQTTNAVKQFQQQNFLDGIASFPLREELYQAVNPNQVEGNQVKAAARQA